MGVITPPTFTTKPNSLCFPVIQLQLLLVFVGGLGCRRWKWMRMGDVFVFEVAEKKWVPLVVRSINKAKTIVRL